MLCIEIKKKTLCHFLDFLALEDWTDRLTRNVGKELSCTLRNIPEEGRSHLLCGGSLKPSLV